MIKIHHSKLSADALHGVIEEFVMREGTDYGHRDFTLDEKRARVLEALEAGRALITFEPESGTTSIVISEDLVVELHEDVVELHEDVVERHEDVVERHEDG